MSREWEPGDVAMAYEEAVVFTDEREWVWATTGLACVTQPPNGLHRVALINPDDREQVERLTNLLDDRLNRIDDYADSVRAALREFANPTPPKPEEPTGLGAVVEGDDGAHYVLVTGDDAAPWAKVPADAWQIECFAWHEFSAVRILSEGVPA